MTSTTGVYGLLRLLLLNPDGNGLKGNFWQSVGGDTQSKADSSWGGGVLRRQQNHHLPPRLTVLGLPRGEAALRLPAWESDPVSGRVCAWIVSFDGTHQLWFVLSCFLSCVL